MFAWERISFQFFVIILIKVVKHALKVYFAPISRENCLRTIESSNKSDRLPLVLLHGMGGGVGLWVMNIDSLSEKQKVYAIDLLGFGRSSRPKFPKDELEAEKIFVQSLEEWRKMVELENFILPGQSFGGYLACSYSISYPDRVKHLILSEPWGMPNLPTEIGDDIKIPRWSKKFLSIFSFFYPFTAFRAMGPLGKRYSQNIFVVKFGADFISFTKGNFISYHLKK